MRKESLSLLCDPETHDPFELANHALRNAVTGRVYPLRRGIPIFVSSLTGSNLRNQALYDRLAPGYDLAERLHRFFSRKSDYRPACIAELELAAGARVLEIAVGTGANLRYLPGDIDYFGIDLSWGMLNRCLRKAARWGRPAELFQCEAERLPFRDAVFDCVFHVGGLNLFSDSSAAIREMIRVAKPGTKIVIVDEISEAMNGSTLLPQEIENGNTTEIYDRKLYCSTFRKPAAARTERSPEQNAIA